MVKLASIGNSQKPQQDILPNYKLNDKWITHWNLVLWFRSKKNPPSLSLKPPTPFVSPSSAADLSMVCSFDPEEFFVGGRVEWPICSTNLQSMIIVISLLLLLLLLLSLLVIIIMIIGRRVNWPVCSTNLHSMMSTKYHKHTNND